MFPFPRETARDAAAGCGCVLKHSIYILSLRRHDKSCLGWLDRPVRGGLIFNCALCFSSSHVKDVHLCSGSRTGLVQNTVQHRCVATVHNLCNASVCCCCLGNGGCASRGELSLRFIFLLEMLILPLTGKVQEIGSRSACACCTKCLVQQDWSVWEQRVPTSVHCSNAHSPSLVHFSVKYVVRSPLFRV